MFVHAQISKLASKSLHAHFVHSLMPTHVPLPSRSSPSSWGQGDRHPPTILALYIPLVSTETLEGSLSLIPPGKPVLIPRPSLLPNRSGVVWVW